MKHAMLIIFFISQTLSSSAQNADGEIKGRLLDSLGKMPLELANVFVYNKVDSVLIKKTLTDENGNFVIAHVPSGRQLVLVISFTGCVNYRSQFILQEKQLLDIGNIQMHPKRNELDTVVVQMRIPPVIFKKDTIEYNAGAFKTHPNAVVEDLLKKLPGLEVDVSGNITFNGKPVSKVLVDGREFFIGNFLMATRNIPADMVSKIQLTDSKTLEEVFNNRPAKGTNKTLNIKLKNSKNELFGYVHAGVGTDTRYESSGMANYFNNEQKITVLASGNNINNIGFSGSGDLGVVNPGNGIVESMLLGANYVDGWGKKVKLNGSYYFDQVKTSNESGIAKKQMILPDSSISSNTQTIAQNNVNGNRMQFTVDLAADSLDVINLSPDFNISHSTGTNVSNTSTAGSKDEKLNQSIVTNFNDQATNTYALQAFWGRRLNERGRSLTIAFNGMQNQQRSNSLNKSDNIFYRNNLIDSTVQLNQRVYTHANAGNYNFLIAYNEPISRLMRLIINENITVNTSNSDKKTFTLDSAGNVISLNSDFSGEFSSRNFTSASNVLVEYVNKKWEVNAGITGLYNRLTNYSGVDKNTLQQSQFNYSPAIVINFHSIPGNVFRINYSANTQQPTPDQLLPIPDNSNPLAIRVGNPDLRPSFSQNFLLGFSQFNEKKSFDFNVQFNPVENKIINSVYYDNFGRQLSQFINIDGNYSVAADISVKRNWSSGAMRYDAAIGTTVSYLHEVTLVNLQRVITQNKTLAERISGGVNVKELLSFTIAYTISANSLLYNPSRAQVSNYILHTLNSSLILNISSYRFLTAISYSNNNNVPPGFEHSSLLWNLGMSKSFFKNQRLVGKLIVYDLLKQNSNLKRVVASNYVEDMQSNVLLRYMLISITYHLKRPK